MAMAMAMEASSLLASSFPHPQPHSLSPPSPSPSPPRLAFPFSPPQHPLPFSSSFLSPRILLLPIPSPLAFPPRRASIVRAASKPLGQNPDWSDDDYIVVGVAHCFRKDGGGKYVDAFVVEPIPAGALECMENGGLTCFRHVTATSLGVVLQQDVSLLPAEFAGASFCDEFDYRVKCASRTWKRLHAVENLLNLAPKNGVRSDYNFSLEDKRVLNAENVVTDADNIKQDMSIDVYGRKEAAPEEEAQIASLYNA